MSMRFFVSSDRKLRHVSNQRAAADFDNGRAIAEATLSLSLSFRSWILAMNLTSQSGCRIGAFPLK